MESGVGVDEARRWSAIEKAALVAAATAGAEAGLACRNNLIDKVYRHCMTIFIIYVSCCAVFLSYFIIAFSKTWRDDEVFLILIVTVTIPFCAAAVIKENRRMDREVVAMAARKALEAEGFPFVPGQDNFPTSKLCPSNVTIS